MFEKKLDFKDIKFPVKISDTHKIKQRKKNCIWISDLGYKNNAKKTLCVKKYIQKTCWYIFIIIIIRKKREEALCSS